MEERNIKELDCSKMAISPNHPQLVNFIEKNIPSIKSINVEYQNKVFTKSMVYRYVLLMYDKNSEIATMRGLDWFEKKYEACAYAGFKLKKEKDGYYRFDKRVTDMVMGKNKEVTDIIIEFLGWSNSAQYDYIVFLKEAMLGLTRSAIGREVVKHKSSQEYMKLFKDYKEASDELAKVSNETDDFINRFYYKIEQSRMAIKPEDFAKALKDGDTLRADNPHGVGYIVDKIKFIGDDEEQV